MVALIAALTLIPTDYRWESVEIKAKLPFAELSKDESASLAKDRLYRRVAEGAVKAGHIIAGNGAGIVLKLAKVTQKNRDRRELLDNPGGPMSWTDVEIEVSVGGGSTRKLKGRSGGTYFGTTDRYELQGHPEAKNLEIRKMNEERADAIGRAVWNALAPVL